jgi:hypothetical protein
MKTRLMMVQFVSLVLLQMTLQGQYKIEPACQNNILALTGIASYDLSRCTQNCELDDSSAVVKKPSYKKKYSPLTAGLLSAAIPGVGQFYTKSYWKGAAFLGAEALMWAIYASYENKGDNKTSEFQTYADNHWSVIRYAYWIRDNYPAYYDNTVVPGLQAADIANPWTYVNWAQLNFYEEQIGAITHSGFSHKLAAHGDQQYYEMIGKYAQFGGGWDDAATFQSGGFTEADVQSENVSPNFLKYRDMRGDANSLYNIGTTVSYLIVANHLLSAVEAAWNASKINHRIKLQGHIETRRIYGNMVEFVPTFHLECEL